jgi:MFS family permease
MGLFPILPLYAAKFNASNSLIGFYFAIMYAANSLGPVVVGWLIARVSKRASVHRRRSVGTPALFLLGFAQNFVQVIALTSLVWFSGGVVMAVVSILTSMHTDTRSRGKAYSLMAMVGPLGALVGGAVGWLAGLVAGLRADVHPAGGHLERDPADWLVRIEGRRARSQQTAASRTAGQGEASARLGSSFMRVLAITFLGGMAINVGRLGSSISMKAMDFSPEAVSSAAMISGLIAIPVTLLIGTLSDRLGRKHFLAVSYLLIVSSALILVTASRIVAVLAGFDLEPAWLSR